MGLEEHFVPVAQGLLQSQEFTEYGMRRIISGEPRIVRPHAYKIYAPKLEGLHIVGDGYCDVRASTVIDGDGEERETLQIGYIAVDPLLYGNGISKLLTGFVISEARGLGRDLSFLFPAGCESMVEKISAYERGACVFPPERNRGEFGLIVLLKREQDGVTHNMKMPSITEHYAVPV